MKHRSPMHLSILALCGCLVALASRAPATPPAPDPGRKLSQYVHDAWSFEDGLPSITVRAILRTRDGYLWLATGEGLVRFDGVRFETFNVENTPVFETDRFGPLAEGADGSLWIGSYGGGLYRYRQGRFAVFPGATPAGSDVRALLVDRSGEVWAGTLDGLYRLHRDRLVAEEAPELAAAQVSSLFEDTEGTLWIGIYGRGVLRRHQDRYAAITSEDGLSSDLVSAVYRDSAGTLWIATYDGLSQLREGWRQDGGITVYRSGPLGGDRGGGTGGGESTARGWLTTACWPLTGTVPGRCGSAPTTASAAGATAGSTTSPCCRARESGRPGRSRRWRLTSTAKATSG